MIGLKEMKEAQRVGERTGEGRIAHTAELRGGGAQMTGVGREEDDQKGGLP
jgi:hypothetical protein